MLGPGVLAARRECVAFSSGGLVCAPDASLLSNRCASESARRSQRIRSLCGQAIEARSRALVARYLAEIIAIYDCSGARGAPAHPGSRRRPAPDHGMSRRVPLVAPPSRMEAETSMSRGTCPAPPATRTGTQRVEGRPVVDAGRFASIGASSWGRSERKLSEACSAVLGHRCAPRVGACPPAGWGGSLPCARSGP